MKKIAEKPAGDETKMADDMKTRIKQLEKNLRYEEAAELCEEIKDYQGAIDNYMATNRFSRVCDQEGEVVGVSAAANLLGKMVTGFSMYTKMEWFSDAARVAKKKGDEKLSKEYYEKAIRVLKMAGDWEEGSRVYCEMGKPEFAAALYIDAYTGNKKLGYAQVARKYARKLVDILRESKMLEGALDICETEDLFSDGGAIAEEMHNYEKAESFYEKGILNSQGNSQKEHFAEKLVELAKKGHSKGKGTIQQNIKKLIWLEDKGKTSEAVVIAKELGLAHRTIKLLLSENRFIEAGDYAARNTSSSEATNLYEEGLNYLKKKGLNKEAKKLEDKLKDRCISLLLMR